MSSNRFWRKKKLTIGFIVISCPTCILQTGLYFTDCAHISRSTRGMDTKLTPVIGLDNRRPLMTSASCWRHQEYSLQTRYRKVVSGLSIKGLRRHNIDDIIDHFLMSRPITGVSLVPIPLVDPEI